MELHKQWLFLCKIFNSPSLVVQTRATLGAALQTPWLLNHYITASFHQLCGIATPKTVRDNAISPKIEYVAQSRTFSILKYLKSFIIVPKIWQYFRLGQFFPFRGVSSRRVSTNRDTLSNLIVHFVINKAYLVKPSTNLWHT